MSTGAVVLLSMGAWLFGWFGGWLVAIWNHAPPPRWVRLNVRAVDSGTGDVGGEYRLDLRAIHAPAAVQVELNDVRVDIWAREDE